MSKFKDRSRMTKAVLSSSKQDGEGYYDEENPQIPSRKTAMENK